MQFKAYFLGMKVLYLPIVDNIQAENNEKDQSLVYL